MYTVTVLQKVKNEKYFGMNYCNNKITDLDLFHRKNCFHSQYKKWQTGIAAEMMNDQQIHFGLIDTLMTWPLIDSKLTPAAGWTSSQQIQLQELFNSSTICVPVVINIFTGYQNR